MPGVATLTISGGGTRAFDFLIAATDTGTVPQTLVVELEQLAVPGVDFDRWREVRRALPPFSLRTVSACIDYKDAEQYVQDTQAAKGRLATLQRTVRGQARTFANVLILDVQARCLPSGPISTTAGIAGATAGVQAVWQLQLTALP